MTTTTGPASINPDTGKPYGLSFPIVTIRDFVNVQKALIDSLGIKKLHAVMGASMGALQAYEWAAGYPQMVGKVIPVIGAGEADGYLIGWLDMWATPRQARCQLEQRRLLRQGRADGRGSPSRWQWLTLHAQHWAWADGPALGRKWAVEGKDPASCLTDCRFAIEAVLEAAGKARAAISDANNFLYLVKANQLFAAGGDFAAGLKNIDAPVLLITSDDDLVFHKDQVDRTVAAIKADGTPVQQVKIKGGRGHLDGVLVIQQAADQIRSFLGN